MFPMVDIDFRYVMREDMYSDEWRKSKFNVLQWRKKIHDPSRGYDDRMYWTEWLDVRTEEE